jgi:Tfp pilus assembly protein PilN
MAAGLAMAACVVAVVYVAALQEARRDQMAALRAEQQRIEAELQDVKEIAKDAEPVFVLENEQGTRVIMDLDSAIQPASLRTYD